MVDKFQRGCPIDDMIGRSLALEVLDADVGISNGTGGGMIGGEVVGQGLGREEDLSWAERAYVDIGFLAD